MTIITQEQITADQAAVAAAQAVLDTANAALAADQTAYTSVQPILAALSELTAYQVHIPPESVAAFLASIAAIQAAL